MLERKRNPFNYAYDRSKLIFQSVNPFFACDFSFAPTAPQIFFVLFGSVAFWRSFAFFHNIFSRVRLLLSYFITFACRFWCSLCFFLFVVWTEIYFMCRCCFRKRTKRSKGTIYESLPFFWVNCVVKKSILLAFLSIMCF